MMNNDNKQTHLPESSDGITIAACVYRTRTLFIALPDYQARRFNSGRAILGYIPLHIYPFCAAPTKKPPKKPRKKVIHTFSQKSKETKESSCSKKKSLA
jgi:hypothetical protein